MLHKVFVIIFVSILYHRILVLSIKQKSRCFPDYLKRGKPYRDAVFALKAHFKIELQTYNLTLMTLTVLWTLTNGGSDSRRLCKMKMYVIHLLYIPRLNIPQIKMFIIDFTTIVCFCPPVYWEIFR